MVLEQIVGIEQRTQSKRVIAFHNSPKPQHKMGMGTAFGHHGETIQGAARFDNNVTERFLVTLPCSELSAQANFIPSRDLQGEVVVSSCKTKSKQAAEATLRYLNRSSFGGHLELTSNIEEGFGLGSSTTDVVASIRAVGDTFDTTLRPEIIARLAVDAEMASDAIMFDGSCVLFAQRRGDVLSYLGSALPAVHVLSVNTAADQPINTLATPPARYSDWELQCFRALNGMLRRAIRMSDPNLLGRVATASAKISQHYLPKPAFADILSIASAHGACGVQVAHSGTVVGLLFDAHCARSATNMAGATKDLETIGMAPDFGFCTQLEGLKDVS